MFWSLSFLSSSINSMYVLAGISISIAFAGLLSWIIFSFLEFNMAVINLAFSATLPLIMCRSLMISVESIKNKEIVGVKNA